MSKNRIVYITELQNIPLYVCHVPGSKYGRYAFYRFHDELTNSYLLIACLEHSEVWNARFSKKPIFLRLTKYYECYDSLFDPDTPAYFNARFLTEKQIKKFKEENAELFI